MSNGARRGNDGLTDAQRHASANRWRNGAGCAPSKAEMDEIRRLTPVTHSCRSCGAPDHPSGCARDVDRVIAQGQRDDLDDLYEAKADGARAEWISERDEDRE